VHNVAIQTEDNRHVFLEQIAHIFHHQFTVVEQHGL